MARNPPWTRDELALALNLYLPARRVPEETEPEVVSLSERLNQLPIHPERGQGNFRSPDAVVMKLANLRNIDPTSSSEGLDAGGKLDREVWDRYANDRAALRREVRRILAPRRYWLKLVYNRERETGPDVWRARSWVSDAHTVRPSGPIRRPGYSVGDELVIYDLEFRRCPARVLVRTTPLFDPERVEREGGATDASRWAWLTEVHALATSDVRQGPTLEDLGVDPLSISQKDHLVMEQWQYLEAVSLLPEEGNARRGSRRRLRRRSSVELLPIEAMNVETTEVRQERQTRTIIRREQRLVRDYAHFLERRGRTVNRRGIGVGDGTGTLYCDVFEEDRRNLVEAKAATDRGPIRMAIGQLADYRRYFDRAVHRGVLLPTRPSPDLESLLTNEGISVVWRAGDLFEDNSGGRFT